MPSEPDSGDDLVFLSPEGELAPDQPDTGASPKLRRSTRKRKSTAGDTGMPRGSESKKKRNSTGNKKSPKTQESAMPKLPRTAANDGPPPTPSQPQSQAQPQPSQTQTLEALLAGMEGRLGSKIDTTNTKVDRALTLVAETNSAIEDLELKVAASEEAIDKKLDEVEARIQSKVKTMVLDQLREAGFEPDLSAGALTMIRNSRMTNQSMYAAAKPTITAPSGQMSQEEKRKMNFWDCRKSLRLWPVKDGSRQSLVDYLTNRLNMDDSTIDNLGELRIRKVFERRPRYADEVIVTFEDKGRRDAVKSHTYKLAEHRDKAGMRLHVPDHVQKTT